jgi:hypothetical protein
MVMINDVLLSVRNRIESALQAAQARDEEWIRLTNLTGLDGAVLRRLSVHALIDESGYAPETRIAEAIARELASSGRMAG